MLARETRTASFAENSNNVMSELFQAIQKVRGSRIESNADKATTGHEHSKAGYLRETNLPNGEAKTFAVYGKEIQANSISGREIPTGLHKTGLISNGIGEDITKLSSGVSELNGSPATNGVAISPGDEHSLNLPNGSPPIAPPLPPDISATTTKPTAASFQSAKLTPVPAWTPNRPQKFVQLSNTPDIFSELTSVLQKRFKNPAEESEVEKSASSTLSGHGRDTDSLKRNAEKKAEHYSHIKEVSEKLVNGLNIVIVDQNDNEKGELGSVNSSTLANNVNNTCENTPPQLVGSINKGNKEIISSDSYVPNGTKFSFETSESSALTVSSLINNYQSSEASSGIQNSKPWTNNKLNTQGSLADFMKKSISEKNLQNGKVTIGDDSVNVIREEDSKNTNITENVDTVLSKPEESEVKMNFELPKGRHGNSSSDEDVVKAVVIHGSLGKSHDPLKGRSKPRSTMTETAIASIILDKAIESDIDSDVFFEKSHHERSLAVSDEEINRYKKEIFGISPISVGEPNDREEEIKVIKDALTSSSTPSSLRSKEFSRPPLSICNSSMDINTSSNNDILESAPKSSTEFKTESNSQYDEDTAILDITDDNDLPTGNSPPDSEIIKSNISEVSAAMEKVDLADTTLDVKDMVDENANISDENHLENSVHINSTNTREAKGDINESLSKDVLPETTVENMEQNTTYRHRFCSFSSYTSSIEGTHNSSEEFVVVADVHVSSDDDKVLGSSIDGSSPVLPDNELPPLVDSEHNAILANHMIHEISKSKASSESADLNNTRERNDETQSESRDALQVTVNQTTIVKTESTTIDAEQLINEPFVINNDSLPQSLLSSSTESLHSNHNENNLSNLVTASDIIINKSVAMETNHSESPTSSLGDYEIPDFTDVGFNKMTEIPMKSSSPAIREHDASENREQNSKTDSQDGKITVASGIEFSEEELDNSGFSDSERPSAVDDKSPKQSPKSSLHSSVTSLTDAEVQNLTRRSSENPTPTLQNFTSLRSTIKTEEEVSNNNRSHFEPVVKEDSYFASSQWNEKEQTNAQSAINTENSARSDTDNFMRSSTSSSSQISPSSSAFSVHSSPVSSGEKNQAVSVIHLNGHQEKPANPDIVQNVYAGIQTESVTEHHDFVKTNLNPKSPTIIANNITDSENEYSIVDIKRHQQLSNSYSDYTNNNSPVAIMHYGPPPPSINIVKNNRVVRHVPVHHIPAGHKVQRNNTVAYTQSGGQRRVFRFDTLAKDNHSLHGNRRPRSPNKDKAATLFYDFSRTANYPRNGSAQTNYGYFTAGSKTNKQYVYSNPAYTVMHIAPGNRNNKISGRATGHVQQTRPLVAGYGPDSLPLSPSYNYSSHDTLASLPFSPDSPNAVFTRDTKLVPQRKPSFTVMTSSSSSFTESLGQEKIFIDLRKPKKDKRSRSQENYLRNNNVEAAKDSFSDDHNSSLDKTSSTAVSSSFTSDINNEPLVRLVSFNRSFEAGVDSDNRAVENKQEFSLPGGVNVKIFTSRETKVVIGSEQTNSEGSPFMIDVDEGRMPTANGDGLFRGEEDRPATFYVDARGLRGELGVQVEGPNSIAKCNIEPERDGVYAVTYVPVEVGKYRAVVKWNGKEIPGSPFHPKVIDPRKVKVVGGWQSFMDANNRVQLLVDEEKRIPFDVTEAGPGVMTAEVRGPGGKIPCRIEESHHKRTVCFTPREEGDHNIYAYWSDHTLVNAPFHGYAVGRRRSPDPTKVVLSGRGLKEAVVHREAEFQIDGSEAGPGRPEVRLEGVKRNIPVRVSSLGNGRYRCTYVPEGAGAFLLHINWNDRQLRGSPFKVHVINAHYPQKVVVTGEGLKGGVMGRDINVIIDTRKAGPGELTAHCMGPHKVAYCELEDMRDGTYKLNIRPQEPGRHILQIKYGGEHVLGSPYVLRVGAQPDASKVRVYGPGVENGVLATFQSRFIVETKGAGAGQLTVRIRGPKGAFQVEMLRDSQKDRTIMCRFDPSETGLYQVFVKWSGVDVPGSPFNVYIVDTENDLRHIHQGQIPPQYLPSTLNRSTYNSEYSSWREDDGYRM